MMNKSVCFDCPRKNYLSGCYNGCEQRQNEVEMKAQRKKHNEQIRTVNDYVIEGIIKSKNGRRRRRKR